VRITQTRTALVPPVIPPRLAPQVAITLAQRRPPALRVVQGRGAQPPPVVSPRLAPQLVVVLANRRPPPVAIRILRTALVPPAPVQRLAPQISVILANRRPPPVHVSIARNALVPPPIIPRLAPQVVVVLTQRRRPDPLPATRFLISRGSPLAAGPPPVVAPTDPHGGNRRIRKTTKKVPAVAAPEAPSRPSWFGIKGKRQQFVDGKPVVEAPEPAPAAAPTVSEVSTAAPVSTPPMPQRGLVSLGRVHREVQRTVAAQPALVEIPLLVVPAISITAIREQRRTDAEEELLLQPDVRELLR
jgi:hypothetical protein